MDGASPSSSDTATTNDGAASAQPEQRPPQGQQAGQAEQQQQQPAPAQPSQDGQRPDQPAHSQQAQQSKAPALPQRPKLAPGVKLAGQMQESAFVDPPWLIEREGAGYVQVTQLLYKVAEQCTGENDYEAIAAKLAEAGQPVRPDTVQRLVAQMLIPLGLVATDGGSAVPVSRKRGSLLAINMRMKMLSPHLINPVTRVFQILYWPPLLLALIVAGFAAQVWIFFVHGVGSGAREALYAPGLLLLIIVSSFVSAAFHEIGHAAALRYGGAEVNGMGAGLYLIYPAFYTDVSDNYRLRRWPRVRTDLGGFYFNLIFSLAVAVLYIFTDLEFLLLIAVLTDFEVIYQLQPFMRLDGYWTLADLTGIPDFFSQMGAFWRSILPLKRWQGQKLPELRWWGKAVFVLYTIITIPLLLLVLFLMIKSLPRVLATDWDSFAKLAGQFSGGYSHGSVLGMVAAAVQIVALAIPTFGMLFIVYTLLRKFLTGIWAWSKRSAPRRVAGGLAVVTVAALLLLLWAPQLPSHLLGRKQAGSVYGQTSFYPIGPQDRGTVNEAVASVPLIGAYVPQSLGQTVPNASPTPSRGPAGAAPLAATQTGTATTTATATPASSATAQVPAPVNSGPAPVATPPLPTGSGNSPASPAVPPPAAAPAAPAASAPTVAPGGTTGGNIAPAPVRTAPAASAPTVAPGRTTGGNTAPAPGQTAPAGVPVVPPGSSFAGAGPGVVPAVTVTAPSLGGTGP